MTRLACFLFLMPAIELSVARGLGEHALPGGDFLCRGRAACLLGLLLPALLLLLLLPLRLPRLFFTDQPGLQQLVA